MKEKNLIELLQELKDKGLTQEFCLNEAKTYKGNYQNNYLSRILNNKNSFSSYFERAIVSDIETFLKEK